MSFYDQVRATVDASTSEERVEVNQRALIDKILARYASVGAVYRELLQNSNDAEATIAEIYFTTSTTNETTITTESGGAGGGNSKPLVTSVKYQNNGIPFRPQDWARLKKIAEGNPDEKKIGAFGVGAYTMFSICEEPLIFSGNQALAFVWKGDALWTKTVKNNNNNNENERENNANNTQWTSFLLPSRDPYPLPDLVEFGSFLISALTFTKSLSEIRVFVDGTKRLTVIKTQVQDASPVQIQKKSSWWKSDGALTVSPGGLFSLKDENSLLESFYHIQVTIDSEIAAVTARYVSAIAKTKISTSMTTKMQRVTKKNPPSEVELQIFLSGQHQAKDMARSRNKRARKIVQSFSPAIGEGRIFIGFRTSQTTGLAAHLAAPFVPTVEREAMDLQDQTLRLFNLELLEFSGMMMRLTLEHGMSTLGEEYQKGASQRAQLELELIQEKEEHAAHSSEGKNRDQTGYHSDSSDEENANPSMWGFARSMAKGMKKTIDKVVNRVEEAADRELLHPKDPRPLCAEEYQAISLMQSFCPRQSTPNPLVGTTLAQGFSRCLSNKLPPVLTRTGVAPGNQARLPYNGMEVFCAENVVRDIVYKNAQEYHDVIAQCRQLSLEYLTTTLSKRVLEQAELLLLIRWWVQFRKNQTQVSDYRVTALKDAIRFFMNGTADAEPLPVFMLSKFRFYVDGDIFRTNKALSVDELPMPDSVLPKEIQDKVSSILIDSSLKTWFSPLPIEVWAEYISHHSCLKSEQPRDDKLRLQVLSTLGVEYTRRSLSEQSVFGSFCHRLLFDKACIPFDSAETDAFKFDIPSNLYIRSAELKAFDGIGNFHKVSKIANDLGICDDFLISLGVRKSVAIEFLFAHLETFKWSSDPKPLVEYLVSATLTRQDITTLKSSRYLPAENDDSRLFAPSELYIPDKDLRMFPFLKLLQWPSETNVTHRSKNGKFLVSLGMNVRPPLRQILRHISHEGREFNIVSKSLEYVSREMGPGGAYQGEYRWMHASERNNLKFMPCVTQSSLDAAPKRGLYSVTTCFSDRRCSVMGFPVLDAELGENANLFGSIFGCQSEPDAITLIQQLDYLVHSAKKALGTSNVARPKVKPEHIVVAFSEIFRYLSTRTSEISMRMVDQLQNDAFIPCLVNGKLSWCRPDAVFFKSSKNGSRSITELLFQVVEYSPFLAATGVRQEASMKDIFQRMIESPKMVLSALGNEDHYRMFLRRVAAQRPFRQVTDEIRESAFLLALTVDDSESIESTRYELAKARDVYIIDNSFFGRMFPVKRAPNESDLEEFYSLIGSKYISKEVKKKYSIVGVAHEGTNATKKFLERIHERSPLLVSPSITSRGLVPNAKLMFRRGNFDVSEVPDLKAVYSLGNSVKKQSTTCCSQPGNSGKNHFYITRNFDWFDVGYAIGELILERCQLEDAFFISSILEAPLEQLRARGFPVEQYVRPELANRSILSTGGANNSSVPNRSSLDSTMIPPPSTSQPPPLTTQDHSSIRSSNGSADLTRDTITTPPSTGDNNAATPNQSQPPTHNRPRTNPSLENPRSLDEQTGTNDAPKEGRSQVSKDNCVSKKTRSAGKVFGSKKLGRALNGFKSGNVGRQFVPPIDSPIDFDRSMDSNQPSSPEQDTSAHNSMESMLAQSVKQSTRVNTAGMRSMDQKMSIPEGLDHGATCERIPGQDLKLFTNGKGETHNGIKVFSYRKNGLSEAFLRTHFDAVESFAVVLERLSAVYNLALRSLAIYHDPIGPTIAFNNGNKSLYFNVRFFYALHYTNNKHQSRACYSYWFVVFAHELAHHMVAPHNKEHSFYTESFMSLYIPKFLPLLKNLSV